jgi:predicted RNase H-like HicB family nuclease
MDGVQEYRLIVHHEKNRVWAEVVELPGCFAAGKDMDELREALTEVIGMYLTEGDEKVTVSHLEIEPSPPPAIERVPVRVEVVAV